MTLSVNTSATEKMKSNKYPKVIKTVEEFCLMSTSEICKLLNSDRSLAIVGDEVGTDRHIVKRYIKQS